MPKLFPLNINHLHDSVIVKRLGEGGFGDVKLYKCREKEKSESGEIIECSMCFVVKQIKCKLRNPFFCFKNSISKQNDSKIKKILLNEYTIGTLLHHRNIRETIDIDLVDNCIIFEYCNGCDFYNYILNTNKNRTDLLFILDKLSMQSNIYTARV
jgi:serine/threonine protein kinase